MLYIGKATSLRDRLKSYFAKDIAEIRSPLIAKIVQDASAVRVEETDSVLEALILEAKLIKKHAPIGNTDNKDNKSWNYVVITNELFPRVLVARERELSSAFPPQTIKHLFGPFPNTRQLREALKIIRRIFPFFDPPFPILIDVLIDVGRQSVRQSVRRSSLRNLDVGRPTSRRDVGQGVRRRIFGDKVLSPAQEKTVRFNQSIGLYPKELNEKEYKKAIRAIVDFFSGRKTTLVKRLEKEMHVAAKRHEFERANGLKRTIFALTHLRDVALIQEDLRTPERAPFRIEGFDVAHFQGAAPRGAMIVIENGERRLAEYRLFTIRDSRKIRHPMSDFSGDDFAALEEVLERRAGHPEWTLPQLMVIDGGKAHLARARRVLKNLSLSADVVSVVKDEHHRPREILGAPAFVTTHEADILLANHEAHRFAISSHRRAFKKRIRKNPQEGEAGRGNGVS